MSSGGKKKDKVEDSAVPLDLGISALLSGGDEERAPSGPVIPNTTISEAVGGDGGIEAEVSEFQRLAEAGRWSELVSVCERRLAEADEPEARLWWVRGHLGALSMPVSFLAAPLESVCRRARDGVLAKELLPVLKETGAIALTRLKEVGARDQVDTLRDGLFDAGVLEPEPTPARRPAAGSPQVGTSRGGAVSVESPKSETGVVGAVKRESAAWPLPPAGNLASPRVSARVLVGSGLLCALLLVLGAQWWMNGSLIGSTVPVAEGFIQERAAAEQMVPAVERRNPVGSLGALFYSIDGSSDAQTGAGAAVAKVEATEAPQVVPTVSDQVPTTDRQNATPTGVPAPPPTAAAPKRGAKERIDTKGPVEGPEFRERLRNPGAGLRPQDDRRGPFDPVMSEPTRRPSPPVLENRDPDRFEAGGVYRVLVRTSVLAEPSYSAPVVGSLAPGDRVFVEAHLGRWVRLRSKRGRGGFVLAEDVQPMKDAP